MADSEASLWWDSVRVALPSIVVIVGWYVANRLQRGVHAKQETRKDRRAAIVRLEDDLRKLRDKCIEYYLDTMSGAIVAIQIKVTAEDVMRQAFLLAGNFSINVNSKEFEDCIVEIFSSATGGHFETTDRKPLDPNDRQLLSLFNNSAMLLMIFEREFRKHYPPSGQV